MQKILFTAVMMTALLTACSSDDDNNTNAPIEPIDNPNGKTLVVYFSKTVPDGVDASTGATQVFNYNTITTIVSWGLPNGWHSRLQTGQEPTCTASPWPMATIL